MLTFPVIPAKAGIQAPLEADIASILGSSLRQNDETGLLNCLIIKCQHYLEGDEQCSNADLLSGPL